MLIFSFTISMAQSSNTDTTKSAAATVGDSAKATDTSSDAEDDDEAVLNEAASDSTDVGDYTESEGFHQSLKTKFIEGNAGFMSLVALALVLGLAFCIERIIYLSLSQINAKRFMADLESKISTGDIEGAKDQ